MGKFFIAAVLLYGCTVLCCEEGIKQSLKGTECQYAECRNGRWLLFKCLSDLPSNSKNQTLNTVCEENNFYSHYSENRAYYKCEHGKLVLKLCGEEETFDAERKMCREISSKRLKGDNNLPFKDNVFIKETKKNCQNGERRKIEGSCKAYYECKDGNEVLSQCSQCENYDEKEKKCRYVFDTPCHTKTKPFPEPEITTSRPIEPRPDDSAPHTTSSEESSSKHSPAPEVIDEGVTTEKPSTEDNNPNTSTFPGPESPQTEPAVGPIVTQPSSITGGYDTSNSSQTMPSNITPTETPSEGPVTTPSDIITETPTTSALPSSECVHRRALPDCKSYLECHDRELVPRRCGWLQSFDSLTNECKYMGYKCYENEKTA